MRAGSPPPVIVPSRQAQRKAIRWPWISAWGSRSGLSWSRSSTSSPVSSEIWASVSPSWTIQTPARPPVRPPSRRAALLVRSSVSPPSSPLVRADGRDDDDDHQENAATRASTADHAGDLDSVCTPALARARWYPAPGPRPPVSVLAREAPDGAAELLGRRRRVIGAGDAARRRDQERRPGAPARAREPRSSGRPPGRRSRGSGRSSPASARAAAEVLGRGRPDHRAHAAEPALAGEARRRSATSSARRSCSGRPSSSASWSSAAPGFEVRTSRKTPAPAAGGRVDQRLERVAAEQRVGGEGVGAEARGPFPRASAVSPTSAWP